MKAIQTLSLLVSLAVWSEHASAMCPFKREAGLAEGSEAAVDPEKLRKLLERLDVELPKDSEVKRQAPFTTFNVNQEIDVTGQHAWQPPGPTDMYGPSLSVWIAVLTWY
jgi:hypothetical protein